MTHLTRSWNRNIFPKNPSELHWMWFFYFACLFSKRRQVLDPYDFGVFQYFTHHWRDLNENSAPLPFANPLVLLVELPKVWAARRSCAHGPHGWWKSFVVKGFASSKCCCFWVVLHGSRHWRTYTSSWRSLFRKGTSHQYVGPWSQFYMLAHIKGWWHLNWVDVCSKGVAWVGT